MTPRIQEVIDHLDSAHAELQRAIAEIPAAMHQTRPGENRWSVAEVVDHLARVEARIVGVLIPELEKIVRAPDGGVEDDDSPVVPTFDMAAMLDRTEPRVAGETSMPRDGMDLSAAWAQLDAERQRLRRAVLAADGRRLGDVVLPHPRFGALNVYQWVVFVGGHEARHIAQVREIGQSL